KRSQLRRMAGVAEVTNAQGLTTGLNAPHLFGDEAAVHVRRALAAQCSQFWRIANTRGERWSPYRTWVKRLEAQHDTLVSFNYDCVVEQAAQAAGGRVTALLPGEPASPASVKLLKLHGSVNWALSDGSCARVQIDDVLKGTPEIAIAAPGESKAEYADGKFGALWREAESAVESAESIVFLGYRFPESDAEARRRILSCIVNNRTQELHVHTVLGADLGHRDAVR